MVSQNHYPREVLWQAMLDFIVADLETAKENNCLLYTSDAADERSSVDLGGRRIIKKKHNER
mgnify:CR=1 FL=1